MASSDQRRKAKNRLSEVGAGEVSIVPAGKNLRKFLLTKEQSEEAMNETLRKLLEGKLTNEARIDEILKESKLSADQQMAAKGAIRLLQSVGTAMPDSVTKELNQLSGLQSEEDEATKKAKAEQAKAETRKELLVELRKEGFSIEEPKPKEEPMDPKVQEQLDAIRKESSGKVDALATENQTLKEELRKERDIRLMSEFKGKAEGFGYRGEEAEKVGKTLKVAKEKLSDEEYKTLEATVEASAKRAGTSELFKELGSSQGGDKAGSYEQKLTAVKAELKKEHSGWSEAKLESEALLRNPSLYNEYLDGNPKQGGR